MLFNFLAGVYCYNYSPPIYLSIQLILIIYVISVAIIIILFIVATVHIFNMTFSLRFLIFNIFYLSYNCLERVNIEFD